MDELFATEAKLSKEPGDGKLMLIEKEIPTFLPVVFGIERLLRSLRRRR